MTNKILCLLFFCTISHPFLCGAEKVHIKVPSLPLTVKTKTTFKEDFEEDYTETHSLKYQIRVHRLQSSKNSQESSNGFEVSIILLKKLLHTIHEDGRRETPYEEEEEIEEDLILNDVSFTHFFGDSKFVLYEGKHTPYLSQTNAKETRNLLDFKRKIFRNGYTLMSWVVLIRNPISDNRLSQSSVEINQGGGLIILMIPDKKGRVEESKYTSEYNIGKFAPFCLGWNGGENKYNCIADAIYDYKKLDAVRHQEKLKGRRMTPLQKKIFEKSKVYKTLKKKMKRLRSELKETLFCVSNQTGEYSLKKKGVYLTRKTVATDSLKYISSLRFSNLGKALREPHVRRERNENPERSFLKMSEEVGALLENKEVEACFHTQKKLTFRKGVYKYTGETPCCVYRNTLKYNTLETNLVLLYVGDTAYSVDQKSRVEKLK